MSNSKSIAALLAKYNLTERILTFKFQGIRIDRKGHAIMRGDDEIFTLEPESYSNGDKWMLSGSGIGVKYFKRISSAAAFMDHELSKIK